MLYTVGGFPHLEVTEMLSEMEKGAVTIWSPPPFLEVICSRV
jgi:hypothetical protein